LDISSHPLHHIWKRCHRLDTWIPWLLGHCVRESLVLQVLIIRHPLLKLNDFQGVSGSGQRLGEKRIGIKSNRRHQGIELLSWNRGRLLIGRRRQRLVLLCVHQRVCRQE
jgi:hypothetical protein